jgi:Dynamin family
LSDTSTPSELLGAVVRLRQGLLDHELPLATADAELAREERIGLIKQLDDYVVPRLLEIDAPLLCVVGGSTGSGKSTLVNSLVRERVTEPGVLRPTTRSPVLVHHPDDAEYFSADRLLPELERTSRATGDQGALQLVPSTSLPAGLAILDAPDVDSVEERNRALAAQLLAAADLWLFVTSAARYADQVPWGFLKKAVERSTAVAVVLDRTTPAAVREVSSHLARMMTSRGLGDAPLFSVPESPVDEQGLLPPGTVVAIRGWLESLAADSVARMEVVRKTLDGAVASLGRRAHVVADALSTQEQLSVQLREAVESTYAESLTRIDEATKDGTMLRGEVLARWQDFVGTGELFRTLEDKVGRLRDKLVSALKGRTQPAERVTVAVESSLETLILEHAEAAAERTALAWRSLPAGTALLAAAPGDIDRASRDLRPRVERTVRDWQGGILDLVRSEGADKRATARFLAYGVNGLGVALMIVIFAGTAGLTGAEVGVAGGTAVVAQKLLEAVFGDQAVRRLADTAQRDLHQRIAALWEGEQLRFIELLEGYAVVPGASTQLRDLVRDLDDARWALEAS